jgi:hypothetical protein
MVRHNHSRCPIPCQTLKDTARRKLTISQNCWNQSILQFWQEKTKNHQKWLSQMDLMSFCSVSSYLWLMRFQTWSVPTTISSKITKIILILFKNRRCPKSQQVQSVECSNVGKGQLSLTIITQSHPTHALKSCTLCPLGHESCTQLLRSNIPWTALVATLDTYDL